MMAKTPSYMFMLGAFAAISNHRQDLSINNKAKHVAPQPFCTKILREKILGDWWYVYV